MLADPFIAFGPEISFSHVKSLFGQRTPARRDLLLCDRQRAENPIQNKKVEQHKHRPGRYPCEHTLAPVHSLVPSWDHRGFPSNRNCAWSFDRMRGGAV